MTKLGNYVLGNWVEGDGDGKPLYNSVTGDVVTMATACLLYTSPSPRDKRQSRMPSSA